MNQRPTRFVTRGTSRIAYDPGDTTNSGPTVILLHELLSDRFAFAPVVAQLEPNLRSIAIDLRGHGASASLTNRQYGMDDLVADLEAVLQREALTSVHLVGHGLGGAIALACAVIRPDLVRSLTLIDPDLGKTANVSAEADSRAQAASASYKELHDRALILYLGQSWLAESSPDRARVIRRNASALAALLTTLGICTFAEAQLSALAMPVALISSQDTPTRMTAHARFVAESARDLHPHKIEAVPGPASVFEDSRASSLASAVGDIAKQI